LSSAEAVDFEVRRAAAGKGVQLIGKLTGIGRQLIDRLAAQHDLVAVVGGIGIGGGLRRHIDLLYLVGDGKTDVEGGCLVRLQRYGLARERREAVEDDGDEISRGRGGETVVP